LQHAEASKAQLALQVNVPPWKEKSAQVLLLRLVPSQVSVPPIRLSPQQVAPLQVPAQLTGHVPPQLSVTGAVRQAGQTGLQHDEVLNVQVALHFSVPPAKPWVAQVLPLRFVPSQLSPAATTPSPQQVAPLHVPEQFGAHIPTQPSDIVVVRQAGQTGLQHDEVLNVQVALHFNVPPAKPWVAQVLPSRFAPSQLSPPPSTPSPQQVLPLQVPEQFAGHVPPQLSCLLVVRQPVQSGVQHEAPLQT
jgi:hypothetical protein